MPVAIHRAAVLLDTPHAFAADLTEPPGIAIAAGRLRGRPSRFPSRLTRCSPATTRSRVRSRSNSAIAPRICICNLPAGVVASMPSAKPFSAHMRVHTYKDRSQFGCEHHAALGTVTREG